MKKILHRLLAIGAIAVFASFPFNAEAQSKKISVQLAWVVGGLHAGFFVAKEKGFYSTKGLDVTINRGFGSGDTAKVVATGAAQFGEVNVPTAIISRGKDIPLTIVGVIIGKAPESILSFAEKGIRKPKDVEGKTFAEASGAAIMVTWPAFAKLAGIDTNKATHIPVEAAAKPAVFFSGQVDWVPGFRPGFDEPIIIRARKEKKKLHFIPWEDFGWKVYGNGLVTHNDLLKREPKTVADFVSATMDGYAYAIAHLDEALAVRDEPDQRRQLRLFARDIASVSAQVRPVFEILRTASATEPEIAPIYAEMEDYRLRNMRQAAEWLAARGKLRVPVERAAEIIWTLASPDVARLLCEGRGWDNDDYADWLEDTLTRSLLPDPPQAGKQQRSPRR